MLAADSSAIQLPLQNTPLLRTARLSRDGAAVPRVPGFTTGRPARLRRRSQQVQISE